MKIRFIKPMRLNRDGKIIGYIVKVFFRGQSFWAYYSVRRPEHYFIKYHGFGLNHEILVNLLREWSIEWIIIHYKGVKGDKYLLSNIDTWFNSTIRVEYTKDVGNEMETYSSQVILPEKEMELC